MHDGGWGAHEVQLLLCGSWDVRRVRSAWHITKLDDGIIIFQRLLKLSRQHLCLSSRMQLVSEPGKICSCMSLIMIITLHARLNQTVQTVLRDRLGRHLSDLLI